MIMKIFNFRNKFKNIFLVLFSFTCGIFYYKYQLPPILLIRDLAKKYEISFIKERPDYLIKVKKWKEAIYTFTDYKKGVPLFLDKSYLDEVGDKRLDGLKLIQIPRHGTKKIKIKSDIPLTVYRLISNEENTLNHKYSKTDIKVKVVGYSLTHTDVVKKDFNPGLIILNPGGPTATNPILLSINNQNYLQKIKISIK